MNPYFLAFRHLKPEPQRTESKESKDTDKHTNAHTEHAHSPSDGSASQNTSPSVASMLSLDTNTDSHSPQSQSHAQFEKQARHSKEYMRELRHSARCRSLSTSDRCRARAAFCDFLMRQKRMVLGYDQQLEIDPSKAKLDALSHFIKQQPTQTPTKSRAQTQMKHRPARRSPADEPASCPGLCLKEQLDMELETGKYSTQPPPETETEITILPTMTSSRETQGQDRERASGLQKELKELEKDRAAITLSAFVV